MKFSADNKLTRSARKPDRIRHAFYLQSAAQEDNLISIAPDIAPEKIGKEKNAVRENELQEAQ